jgi:flagellin
MASVINTNLASLYAQKNLSGAQSALSTSVERLSSGLRINRAKDDAAGLGISQKINSQVVSLNQGIRNANDAISMVQTAEGSLSEVSSILARMKELSVQARNDSLSTTQRSYISDELVSLKNEINAIAERTTFNDISLLKNGLRSTVAGSASQAGQLANGAEILDGVTVSNVTLKNTNVGTYSFSSSTRTLIGAYETGSQDVTQSATTSAGTINLTTSSGSITSTVSAAADAYAASARTIDLNVLEDRLLAEKQEKLDEDIKVTLTIGGNDFVAYVGSTNSESEGAIATALTDVLQTFYFPTASETAAGLITISNAAVGLAEMTIKAEKIGRGDQVANISSSVEAPDVSTAASERTIYIKDADVVAGREFVVRVGNPDQVQEYSVTVGTGDTASDVVTKLNALMDLNYSTAASTTTLTISTATTDLLGMANITLSVYDTKATGTLYLEDAAAGQNFASSQETVLNDKNGAATARTVTIGAADLEVGNTVSVKINGKEYAVTVGQDGVTNNSEVAYALTSQIAEDYRYVSTAGVTTNWVSNTAGTGAIVIASSAALGLADIAVEISRISDPGKLKLVADTNTGIGGTSQGIDVGTVANGASKTYDFDNLGVSFTVTNNSGSELNANDFAALSSKVSQLTVAATMNGEALFQVGAGTRDNVVIDGFKDIRITGYNRNSGADKTVFDNLASTLDTIALNTTESLSVANFATLENQIEDAITTISDFRSYLGAQQNRIEFAISNIQAQSENLTAANSRIVDTDYAAETANLTKTQIMQQAATAMLAQANQMPNVILALLK